MCEHPAELVVLDLADESSACAKACCPHNRIRRRSARDFDRRTHRIVNLRRLLLNHQPKAFKIAALLDKPARRIQKIEGDYIGFTIPNKFVVGYGLDYAERYRNLPDICTLPESMLDE